MKGHYTNSICGVELPTMRSNKKRSEYIDITIGVFFDGTENNKYNIYFNQKAKDIRKSPTVAKALFPMLFSCRICTIKVT